MVELGTLVSTLYADGSAARMAERLSFPPANSATSFEGNNLLFLQMERTYAIKDSSLEPIAGKVFWFSAGSLPTAGTFPDLTQIDPQTCHFLADGACNHLRSLRPKPSQRLLPLFLDLGCRFGPRRHRLKDDPRRCRRCQWMQEAVY
jgi:hypothetical protein